MRHCGPLSYAHWKYIQFGIYGRNRRRQRWVAATRTSHEPKEKIEQNFNEFPRQRTEYGIDQQFQPASVVRVLKMYLSFIEWLLYERPFILITLCKFIYWFFPPCTYLLHFFSCSLFASVVARCARHERTENNYHFSGCFFFFGFCYLHWTGCRNDKTTAMPAKILSVDGLNSNLLSLVDYYSFVQCRARAVREIYIERERAQCTAWQHDSMDGFFFCIYSHRLVAVVVFISFR